MPVRVGNGNRCGHDLRAPRFFQPPPKHAARPPIIVTHIKRLNEFYDNPDCIPSLAYAHSGRRPPDALIHPPRRMRSERREACCALLGAIAHYCDLPSMTLSVPQPDGKTRLPVRLETLADAAGLGLRRAERAMRDIQSAGLLRTFTRAERMKDGSYRGRAAIRVVPTAVFGLFGQEKRLEYERERISQARIKARETQEPTPTQKARGRLTLGGQIAPASLRAHHPSSSPPPPSSVHRLVQPLHHPAPRSSCLNLHCRHGNLTRASPNTICGSRANVWAVGRRSRTSDPGLRPLRIRPSVHTI